MVAITVIGPHAATTRAAAEDLRTELDTRHPDIMQVTTKPPTREGPNIIDIVVAIVPETYTHTDFDLAVMGEVRRAVGSLIVLTDRYVVARSFFDCGFHVLCAPNILADAAIASVASLISSWYLDRERWLTETRQADQRRIAQVRTAIRFEMEQIVTDTAWSLSEGFLRRRDAYLHACLRIRRRVLEHGVHVPGLSRAERPNPAVWWARWQICWRVLRAVVACGAVPMLLSRVPAFPLQEELVQTLWTVAFLLVCLTWWWETFRGQRVRDGSRMLRVWAETYPTFMERVDVPGHTAPAHATRRHHPGVMGDLDQPDRHFPLDKAHHHLVPVDHPRRHALLGEETPPIHHSHREER